MNSVQIRDAIVSRLVDNGMVSFSFLRVMIGIESNLLTYYLDDLIGKKVIERVCRATYELRSIQNYFNLLRNNN